MQQGKSKPENDSDSPGRINLQPVYSCYTVIPRPGQSVQPIAQQNDAKRKDGTNEPNAGLQQAS